MVDEQPEEERDRNEADAESESGDAGRREFIKKLPYVASVIQTFLFREGALAGGTNAAISAISVAINAVCRRNLASVSRRHRHRPTMMTTNSMMPICILNPEIQT
ncbi:MAG: hypothetical protein CME13_11820 [Gemmatimonadetes bacterium]|jgi:hypothetical protein|nr:hypothetical protein [Gemmatimonadota bacterium]MDP7361184.1 hypothetical protein [Candidatus Latescibacterota bacterium]|tara:strand:- start:135 stop:449 length:315 start_codon:yes stop_codon:yes gene_type:complete